MLQFGVYRKIAFYKSGQISAALAVIERGGVS